MGWPAAWRSSASPPTSSSRWCAATSLMCLLMAALAGRDPGLPHLQLQPGLHLHGGHGQHVPGLRARRRLHQDRTKSGTAVAMLVPVIALGLPIMDTLLAMVRRAAHGQTHVQRGQGAHPPPADEPLLLLPPPRGAGALRPVRPVHPHRAGAQLTPTAPRAPCCCAGWASSSSVLMRKLGYLNLRDASAVGQTRAAQHPAALAGARGQDAISRGHGRPGRLGGRAAGLRGGWTPARLELRLESGEDGLKDGVIFEASRPAPRRPAFPRCAWRCRRPRCCWARSASPGATGAPR